MTRGEFERVRQRMRGMDGDIRRVGQSSNMAAQRADRFGQSIREMDGRLAHLSRTGRMATSEMTHLRRTFGLMGRDLRQAVRAGELTEDQFRSLSRQLDRTRLDFDYLDRDIQRHNAIAQRLHRDEMARQRQAAAAARQLQRDQASAARAAAQAAAAAARQQRDEQRNFMGASGDSGLSNRVRQMGGSGNLTRMDDDLTRMRSVMTGLAGDSDRARHAISMFSRDTDVMGRMLRQARDSGTMTRRELAALSNGLDLLSRNARTMRSDMGSSAYRAMARDIRSLRGELRSLGRDHSVFDRMGGGLVHFQRRMRDVDRSSGLLRRSFARMGDWGAGGMRGGLLGLGLLLGGLNNLRAKLMENKRWAAILIAVLMLIAPAAALLGALLVTALGGAFIALGALALKGSATVKGAFESMKSSVISVMKTAAAPMKNDLVAGMYQVRDAVIQMGPALQGTFAATGPLIGSFAGAITDLVGHALPGFTSALQASGPVMAGFRTAMGMIGAGLGDMFAKMTAGGGAEALRRTWEILGTEIYNLLDNLGEFIAFSANSESAMMILVGVFRAFGGALETVQFILSGLDAVFGGLFDHIIDGVDNLGRLKEGITGVGDGFVGASKPLSQLKQDLAKVNEEIKKTKEWESRNGGDIKGPAGDYVVKPKGVGDLDALNKQRIAIENAIAAAVNEQNQAYANQVKSINDVISALNKLNDANRSNLDARAAMEQAIDDAEKSASKYAGALKLVNGSVDLTTDSARKAYAPMSELAGRTRAYIDSLEKSKAPVTQIAEAYRIGHDELVKLSTGLFGSSAAASVFADSMLRIPTGVNVELQMHAEDALRQMDGVITQMTAMPDAKAIHVQALTAEAVAALRNVGFKVVSMPDGSFTVMAQTGGAQANIAAVQRARDSLSDKTITITTVKIIKSVAGDRDAEGTPDLIQKPHANGGIVSYFGRGGFARSSRGSENHIAQIAPAGAWRVWAEDETGGEAYIPMAMSKRQRSMDILADVADRFGYSLEQYAKGGTSKAKARAKAKAKADAKSRAKQSSEAAKEAGSARNEILGSMNIAPLWRLAGSKVSPFRKSLAQSGGVGDLIKSINDWRDKIKKATAGSVEKRLVNTIGKTGAFLVKHQMALTKMNAAVDKAKDKLNDLKDKAAQLSEQVSSNVVRSGDITDGVESGKVTSSGAIMARLQTKQRKAAEFASMLQTLKARGLGGQALSEIGSAGIEGGGFETAKALMKASSGLLQQINMQQRDIAKSAAIAGKTTADAMYAAGIKAAEGVVKALQKNASKIAASMMNAVVALERAIKRALGKKGTGGIVGAAGGGPRSRHTLVGEYGPEIVDLAAGSMVRSNSDSRRIAASMRGGGGGQPIEVVIHLDGKVIARQIVDPLRAEIWHRSGGNVQKALGRGAR